MTAAPASRDDAGEMGLTLRLAHDVAALRFADLSRDVVEMARLCVLDWVGVVLAARNEPLVRILRADQVEAGGTAQASVIGHGGKLPVAAAAQINAAAAHALDYDDANLALVGHPSAPLLAGLLALAEAEAASAGDVITAFVAGYDLVCRLGAGLGPEHYDRGYHTTATAGTVAVAGACARLFGLDAAGIAHAMAIAATRAAGLRGVFGTMLKPLQVGFAAGDGVRAALLARRGMTGPADLIERRAGFLATLGGLRSVAPGAAAAHRFSIRSNLFKFHASCLLANAPAAAAVAALAEAGPDFAPDQVRAIRLTADPAARLICDDREPTTGLAMKFSLVAAAALVLAGRDTGMVDTFSDENARAPDVVRLRDLATVHYLPQDRDTICRIEIDLADGRTVAGMADVSQMPGDLAELGAKLERKFTALAVPALGEERARRAAAAIMAMDASEAMGPIVASWQTDAGE